MKKLKLDPDQIQVVSFTMETTKGSGGTVNGFASDGGFTDDHAGSCHFCNPDTIITERC